MTYDKSEWRFKPSRTEFVCLIGGILAVLWYAWIIDDAYVYFRYVDNWVVHQNGLVWNRGEYVEGFSSPLWMLLLASLRAMRLDYWVIIRIVSIFAYVAFWYLCCIINRDFSLSSNGEPSRSYNVPLIYLTFTYAVASYFSSGLESPLVNLSAAIYAAGIMRPHSKMVQAMIGFTPLVRHEFIIPLGLYLLWTLFVKKIRPFTLLLSFVVCVGGYGIFRIWYYADWLPNTFYLKETTSIVQGFIYVYDTLLPYFMIPFILMMGLIYHLLRKRDGDNLRQNDRLLMIVLSISVTLFVIKIGGDPRHFRYLAFPYILVVLASGGLFERLQSTVFKTTRQYADALLLIFALTVSLCYPRQLQQHPIFRDKVGYSQTQFLSINDAAKHRFDISEITPPLLSIRSNLGYKKAKERAAFGNQNEFADLKPQETMQSSLYDAPLMATGWCQTAFFHPDSQIIQWFGLTDPFLARTDMQAERTAHKYGLQPLALDMLQIRSQYGFQRGAFEQAIANNEAPEWVTKNIVAIEKIEGSIYNNHNFFDNLSTVLSPRAIIDPN